MGFVDDLLQGIPVNAILREKIEAMHATINSLTEKNTALEKANANLVTKNAELIQQLSEQTTSASDFTKIRGLKIRNLPTGGYEETIAYCFHCESPMSSPRKMKALECTKCDYKSSIQARHLRCVIAELKGEELPDWWKQLY